MLFLSFFFLVTSHGLKSFISCSMSWQIIQQKDRYYSEVLTLLFPAPISNEGERMKISCFKCLYQRSLSVINLYDAVIQKFIFSPAESLASAFEK